ncbi:MAG TPA: enoyl-[acyl-carrier-protein] reductase FabV [Streptosporangiaceae bacterium]|nr:enoyl-[acyl-carrier-protein] reductase FabV [Streptosporangiaceae bacterium]
MVTRVLRPEGKGFLFLDSHPEGCARIVEEMVAEVATPAAASAAGQGEPGPAALVIGCSGGYGLAATAAGLFGHAARTIGVCYERPATARRSASAGWYRTAALARLASAAGLEFEAINGDCFDPAFRAEVLDRVAVALGPLDVVIYSVAAPRRTDPRTGTVYHAAVKPIGSAYTARNVAFTDGAVLREVTLEPANDEEAEATVKVMGGEDWADWVADLAERGLLAPGCRTVALTYVGSELTAPIYRQGTIGQAKDHLEATAGQLTSGVLAGVGGTALTSVNCAAVTMSSLAIPGISLYLSLLRAVAGDAAESAMRQSVRLWDYLTGRPAAEIDSSGRLRLDDWEMAADVQAALHDRWGASHQELIGGLADTEWFRTQFWRLYGFGVSGIDYSLPVEVDQRWPARPTWTPAPAGAPQSAQPEQVG